MTSRNFRLIQDYLDKLNRQSRIELKKHPEQDRWLITIPVGSQNIEGFSIEIFLEDPWVSFSSLIMKNLQGQKVSDFYEAIALLSSYLNSLKISIDPENDYIVLQHDVDLDSLNNQKEQYIRKIFNLFYEFFEKYYPDLIKLATNLSLQYRTEHSRKSEASDFVKHMIGDSSRTSLNPNLAEKKPVIQSNLFP
ncbi:hypothetical protein C8255_15560 [filamentous cyanobacterium CCP3]|nr:hypothetical protein C8255_15560 [filamentous cyanobacterium CCP3]